MKLDCELLAIAARLKTQDDRCTAEPMFCVQERRREYGYHPDYAVDYVWIDDDCEETTEATPGARKVYYKDHWRDVMVAFTEHACEIYIRQNKHNLGETRIYAKSFYRCYEMIDIRAWLMSKAGMDALEGRERERATEWEGLAASRLEALEAARRELADRNATCVPQRNAIDLLDRLEAVGYGKPGTPNTLYSMVLTACDDIERLKRETDEAKLIAHGVEEGAAEWESDCKDAQERIALLEKSLRFIEHVDKTPFYGCTGLQADKDRRGQLPEKSGQRWKTPREMVRELKLPVVEGGAA